jgi:hypothetical protein
MAARTSGMGPNLGRGSVVIAAGAARQPLSKTIRIRAVTSHTITLSVRVVTSTVTGCCVFGLLERLIALSVSLDNRCGGRGEAAALPVSEGEEGEDAEADADGCVHTATPT